MRIGRSLFGGLLAVVLSGACDIAGAETALPEVRVNAPKEAPRRAAHKRTAARPPAAPPGDLVPPTQQTLAAAAARDLAPRSTAFNRARDNILTKLGTSTYDLNHDAIEALPQGSNAPLGKVLLQAPGVHQDSSASGEGPFHVRNEHGFVQYGINGILLPSGIVGFGQVLETGFIDKLSLVTGALPAQYGFRTAALVDITTRSGLAPGGSVSIYGGSRETVTPSFEYGSAVGKTEYFVTGRYFASNEGIENPTPSLNPIHDDTRQGKFFGYASTLLDDTTRLSIISGTSVSEFQVPNNPGQTPGEYRVCRRHSRFARLLAAQ